MKNEMEQILTQMRLLTLAVGSHSGYLDWASVGAVAFAAEGVVLPGLPAPERRVAAAGWWLLRDDPVGQELSVAAAPPVTAASGVAQASAAVVAHQEASGQGLLLTVSAAVLQTVASELEGNLPGCAEESLAQKQVSGLEEHLDLVAVVELQGLGLP